MNKKDFIQRTLIRRSPLEADIDASIDYAEKVWHSMCKRGYGAIERQSERDVVDYYKKLTVFQKEHFDNFWLAFGYKEGKQGAAQSFLKLGELSEPEYLHITKAAKAENSKPRDQNSTRKMAQGWLSLRRFDDYEEKGKRVVLKVNPRIQEISGELTSLRRFELSTPGQFSEQIESLEAELNKLREA